MRKLGLYIHIPFCKSKCNYCDFYSITDASVQKKYVERIIEEIDYRKDYFSDRTVDTIYFGGGTPTSLQAGLLNKIFESISKGFNLQSGAEITVEANPDTINGQKVEELSRFANRISLGVQSLDDSVLSFIGRAHDSKGAIKAIDLLLGKFDLSADLILGLPKSNVNISVESAKKLLNMGISHLSCYGLKVEENTPFYKLKNSGTIFPDSDEVAVEYDAIVKICRDFGLERYEVSNFALMGKECKHNLRYWKREDYLGLGVSAHSLYDKKRTYNPSDIKGYLTKNFDSFLKVEEVLNKKSELEEEIMLAFRLRDGLDLNKINKLYDIDFCSKYSAQLKKLSKCLNISEKNISIKDEFFYAMNSIIVEFLD